MPMSHTRGTTSSRVLVAGTTWYQPTEARVTISCHTIG